MNPTAILFYIVTSLNLQVCPSEALTNLYKYTDTVAFIESDMNRFAVNSKSSASSYFQMTIPSFDVAKKRAKRMGWDIDAKYVGELDYDEQRALVLIDLYQRKGTNKYLKLIGEGNLWAAKQVYYKIHHTDVRKGDETHKRAQRIFEERY